MPECQDIITSEEYGDFIWEIAENPEIIRQKYSEYCPQLINYRYVCAYERLDRIREIGLRNYSYSSIPKLFGLMDTTAVAATGAIRLQNQTGFELTGRDVIVGFITPTVFSKIPQDKPGYWKYGIKVTVQEIFRMVLIMEACIRQ